MYPSFNRLPEPFVRNLKRKNSLRVRNQIPVEPSKIDCPVSEVGKMTYLLAFQFFTFPFCLLSSFFLLFFL